MQGNHSGLDHRLNVDLILDPHSTLRQKARRTLDLGLNTWKGNKSRGAKEAFTGGGYCALVVDVGRIARNYHRMERYVASHRWVMNLHGYGITPIDI